MMLPNARLRAEMMFDLDEGSQTSSFPSSSEVGPPSQPSTPIVKASDFESTKAVRGLFIDPAGRVRPRSVSAGESAKPDLAALRDAAPTEVHSRRSSNNLFFDAVGRLKNQERIEAPSGHRRASAPDIAVNNYTAPTYPYDYSPSYPQLHHPCPQAQSPYPFAQYEDATPIAYQHPTYPTYSYSYAPENPYMYASMSNWDYSSPVMSQMPHSSFMPRSDGFLPPRIDTSAALLSASAHFSPISPISPSPITPLGSTSSKSYGPRLQQPQSALRARAAAATSPPAPPPERNLLNIRKIEEGLDTRTTVMIKNIPNKMSDKDLLTFVNKICCRRVDFVYLRMDFQNGLRLF